MIEYIDEEVNESLRWLVQNTAIGTSEELIECLLPKISNYLPIFRILLFKRKLSRWIENPTLFKYTWFLGLKGYNWKVKNRVWPKTKEINFDSSLDETSSVVVDQSGSILLSMSMQSYGTTLTALANSLSQQEQKIIVLVPEEAREWNSLKDLTSNVRITYFEGYLNTQIKEKFRYNKQQIEEDWEKISLKIKKKEAPLLIRDIFYVANSQLKYVITEIFPQLVVYDELLFNVFKDVSYKAVVVSRLKRITENILVNKAKTADIPVFVANHGHVGCDWNPLELGRIDQKVQGVFAWNEIQKRILQKLFPDMEKSKIHIVGGIQWDDNIKQFRSPDRRTKCRKILTELFFQTKNQLSDKLWVLIGVDDFVPLADILDSLKSLNNLVIVVKTRPHHGADEYSNLNLQRFKSSVVLVTKEVSAKLPDLLAASDLVVTCVSTMNLDALSVGTPVLTLNTQKKVRKDDRQLKLDRYGLPVVNSIKEFSDQLSMWASNQVIREKWITGAHRATKDLIMNFPKGDAGEKILGIINKQNQVTIAKNA
jgi:spore coat polysaccharide biosynthesis predicted glycosyltransferase SpsG